MGAEGKTKAADKAHETETMAFDKAPSTIDVNSPEFKQAVADAAAVAVGKLWAQMQPGANLPAIAGGGDKSFIEGLTLSLAELANQGTGRIYTAPEVLADRAAARERMEDLILEARRRGTPPTYKLTGKVELANQVIEPMWLNVATKVAHPTEIDWYGVPNDAMHPMNPVADAIKAEFIRSIGNIKTQAPPDRLGMTPRGLVVRGSAIPTKSGPRAPLNFEMDNGELTVRGLHDKEAPPKPVLGTVFTGSPINPPKPVSFAGETILAPRV